MSRSRAAALDAGRALAAWDGGGLRSWLGVSCRRFPVLSFACNFYRLSSSFFFMSACECFLFVFLFVVFNFNFTSSSGPHVIL